VNILLTLLFIILSIICFLIILLSFPATIYLELKKNSNFKYRVKYLFIDTDKFIIKKKNKKQKEKDFKDKSAKKDDTPLKDKISFYCNIIKKGLYEIKFILSFLKIKNLNLKIICSSSDAAFTAITFGAVCSAVYPLLGFIESLTKVKKGAFNLDIRSDYNSKESDYSFNSTFSLPLIFAIIGGLRFFIFYKKQTSKK